jgi:hypothetical protein
MFDCILSELLPMKRFFIYILIQNHCSVITAVESLLAVARAPAAAIATPRLVEPSVVSVAVVHVGTLVVWAISTWSAIGSIVSGAPRSITLSWHSHSGHPWHAWHSSGHSGSIRSISSVRVPTHFSDF